MDCDYGNGVIVGVTPGHKKHPSRYRVRLPHGQICEATWQEMKVLNVEPSSFPLGDLPAVVLALVLFWTPMREAAQFACVSRRFAAAFRDNVVWERRCVSCLACGTDISATLAAEKETSWMNFYRRHRSIRVRIVTVFHHMGGVSLSGEFEVAVSPFMRVSEFLEVVANHVENRQHCKPVLSPHDPSKLGRRVCDFMIESANRGATANCVFRSSDESVSITAAGLYDGAVLEQQERLMRD